MANTEDQSPDDSAFVGIVQMNDAGVVPPSEHERLRRAIMTNYRVVELRHGWRNDYLTAEARVAKNIKDQRVRAGMSQDQLAQTLQIYGFDLHQSTIAKIESGKRPLRLAEMFALADALNVPWMNLMEGGRDIDILPTDGAIPVDVWEAELEELVLKREDVMADIVQTVEEKARAYAEWDRMILVRVAALGNAAARARASDDANSPEIDALVDKWLRDASASRRARDEAESPERQAAWERKKAEMEAAAAEQRVLVDEFLRWRDGKTPNSAQ